MTKHIHKSIHLSQLFLSKLNQLKWIDGDNQVVIISL